MQRAIHAVIVAALGALLWTQSASHCRAKLAEPSAVCGAQLRSGVPASRLRVLARGFNLTSWLEGPRPMPPSLSTLSEFRSRGFTHVRLPVEPELLMPEFSTRGAIARQFRELDRAMAMLTGLGFAVSLDLHPGGRFSRLQVRNPTVAIAKLKSLWRIVAHRYAIISPEQLFFEVLNEPSFNREIWSRASAEVADVIRGQAPSHTIIYDPADYQTFAALGALTPLRDTNVIYAVHFYQPMIFTHQGLTWSDRDPLRFIGGVPFPAKANDAAIESLISRLVRDHHLEAAKSVAEELRRPWTDERIAKKFDRAANWIVRYQRPVILNEFGVLKWKAPPTDRAHWLSTVRHSAERLCIGWTHWDYAGGFGLVSRSNGHETIDDEAVRALIAD